MFYDFVATDIYFYILCSLFNNQLAYFAIRFLSILGEFNAYWKDVFQSTKALIPSYGTTPNKATFDPEYCEKRNAAHADPNHVFKIVDAKGNVIHYDMFTWLVAEVIKIHFITRSSKEPSMMVVDDFVFFVETKGAFKGCKAVVLKSNNAGQKNKSLTVSKHTQKEIADHLIHVPIYQLNADDPMDEYNIVDTYINKLLPPKEMLQGNQRIFRYKAGGPQIKVSSIKYYIFMSVCDHCRC